jgi:LPS-assembly protein
MKNCQSLIMFAVLAVALLVCAPHDHATAQDSSKFLIIADEADYDREKGLVVASGNVEIIYGNRTLIADRLSYDQRTDTVKATGNIILIEPSGEVYFSEYVELTDEMKNGVIEQIRVLLSDDSRLAGVGGRRIGGYRTEMSKAVFSPCEICREQPNRPPLWQIKAQEVVHDSNERTVSYRNAFLEMFGIPVAYTPYFSHPDPTVVRKTGLLVPQFGSTSSSGKFLQVPYFWAVSPDKDVTFDPIFTAEEYVLLSGEYRQRFDNGEFQISGGGVLAERQSGSIESAKQEGRELRGHILSKVRFDVDDTWRWGIDIERVSDRTYFERFPFFGGFGNALTSTAFVEGFRGRNYAAANTYLFQDLRTDETLLDEPVVLPMLDFNHVGVPNDFGGRWSLDANARVLFGNSRTDSHRISLKPGFSVPYYAEAGYVTTLKATVQTDLYYVRNDSSSSGRSGNDITGRFFPQGVADWRYPFFRQSGSVYQLIEPVLGIVVAPNGSNPDKIRNEESDIINFDETNLLSADRIPGLDRVESGHRTYYGFKAELHGERGGFTTMFVGQSYRPHADENLSNAFGLEKHFSDYVGRLDIVPNDKLDVRFRFRADKDDLTLLRSELGFNVKTGPLGFNGEYIFVDSKAGTSDGSDKEELRARISSDITDDWKVAASTVRDLEREESRSNRISLIYEDICFTFNATYSRSYTTVAEVGRSAQLFFRLTFKHLGEVQI